MAIFCTSTKESNGSRGGGTDRMPYAAGRFYPGDSAELSLTLARLFQSVPDPAEGPAIAVISPHAGYVFSGEVAASAFKQIDRDKKYRDVFVIASSHRAFFDGASIYNQGNYVTPLGKVRVDTELANNLIETNQVFKSSPLYHDQEHSLEVQLPFLQYWLKQDFQIIPLIVGTDNSQTCEKIGEALKPYLKPDNLFVISTDFSHYPSYADAVTNDNITAKAIVLNSPDLLLSTLKDNEKKHTEGLATSLCGYTSVLSLLYMIADEPGLSVEPVMYRNSGDSPYGEKGRVVGYYSLAVRGKLRATGEEGFRLSGQDKKDLLRLARHTLEVYLDKGNIPDAEEKSFSGALHQKAGAFVTLRKDGQLRGCIGRFTADEPLYMVVRQMAVAAATQDYRFSPVNYGELEKIKLEISVLTPLQKIDSPDQIILGKHGIYLKKGLSAGTFLPQVAKETGWTKEEFLGHCARDKAGIGWDGWKDAELYVYEALVFEED